MAATLDTLRPRPFRPCGATSATGPLATAVCARGSIVPPDSVPESPRRPPAETPPAEPMPEPRPVKPRPPVAPTPEPTPDRLPDPGPKSPDAQGRRGRSIWQAAVRPPKYATQAPVW